jgi:hypothetical protein
MVVFFVLAAAMMLFTVVSFFISVMFFTVLMLPTLLSSVVILVAFMLATFALFVISLALVLVGAAAPIIRVAALYDSDASCQRIRGCGTRKAGGLKGDGSLGRRSGCRSIDIRVAGAHLRRAWGESRSAFFVTSAFAFVGGFFSVLGHACFQNLN